jgi:energy-coupling factor transport system permease protein
MPGSTLYIERDSGLHKLHPLTKLALTALALASAAALPGLPWLLSFYVLVLLPSATWGKLLGAFLRASLTVVLPFAISLAVIQGFFAGGETVLFQLGKFHYTLQGFLAGMTVAARILVALGGTLLLMLSTPAPRLMLALTERGFPSSVAYIMLTAIQIFPRFQDRAKVITDAQQARGLELEVGFAKRLGLLLPLVGPLILGSIVDVEERAMALEARGFSSPAAKTSLLTLRDTLAQRAARRVLLLAAIALLAWRVWSLVQA